MNKNRRHGKSTVCDDIRHDPSSDQRAQRFYIWTHHRLQTDKKETMNKLGIGWPCCCPSTDATASQCVQFGQIVRGMDSCFLNVQYPQAMATIQTTSKRTASLSAAPSNVLSSRKVLYSISLFTTRINSREQFNKPTHTCFAWWCGAKACHHTSLGYFPEVLCPLWIVVRIERGKGKIGAGEIESTARRTGENSTGAHRYTQTRHTSTLAAFMRTWNFFSGFPNACNANALQHEY